MSATTLVVVNAPTLSDGLVELLRIADAVAMAGADCGVSITRDIDGRLVDAEADYDVPAGVLETATQLPVSPWSTDSWADYATAAARRELLELLATVNPSRDMLATADWVGYLDSTA